MSYFSPATSRAARLPKLFAVIVAEPPCSFPVATLCPSPASNLQYLDIKLSGEGAGKKILTSRYFGMAGRGLRACRRAQRHLGRPTTSDDPSVPTGNPRDYRLRNFRVQKSIELGIFDTLFC